MAQNASFGKEVKGHPGIYSFYTVITLKIVQMSCKCMITLGTTLTSRFILNLIEIGKVTNILFFALKSVQNATFENEVFAWLEIVKVADFDEE